ncbi:hypothetical protein MLD52_15545 [Puniceicoccaceae bacterium K14]|nr:hypothetical protein [Puniceicoccaceae bacterium K14]
MNRSIVFRTLKTYIAFAFLGSPVAVFSQVNSGPQAPKGSSMQMTRKSQPKIDKVARRKAAREKADKIMQKGKPSRYPYRSSVEMPSDV